MVRQLPPAICHLLTESGDVAQLGEHRLCKAGVRGSSPLVSTEFQPRTSASAGLTKSRSQLQIL